MPEARAVQFWYELDLTDPKALFVYQWGGPPTLWFLQSHGWLDGTLVSGTPEEAAARFDPKDRKTWPEVAPRSDLKFMCRYGKEVVPQPFRISLDKIREPSTQPPRLSVVFARWGGRWRIGEDHDPADDGDGGWGGFGCPPSDWYIDAVIQKGLMRHPTLGGCGTISSKDLPGSPGGRDLEVVSLFLGSKADMKSVSDSAPQLFENLRGARKASFWMLWPVDWEADFGGKGYEGYVERRALFNTMRACESAGIRTTFPHPAKLYETITGKSWMATLSPEPQSTLPAAILVPRKDINRDSWTASSNALRSLEELRANSCHKKNGGPSVINRNGVQKGVVKIGWSWEARYVWFWNGQEQLAKCLSQMVGLPGCLAENCIVQEWVDFDFELRFFFFPKADWAPPAILEPVKFEYTAWGRSTGESPGAFLKYSPEKCLEVWKGDEKAMASAHAQAKTASQYLITWLREAHAEPVPMMRMDFMLKRLGPGEAQVVFGEYCECGACCLKWEDGPPTVWRSCVDYALR